MAGWVLDREGGRYNIQAAENGNGVSAFMSSAGKSTGVQKGLFFGRRRPSQQAVAMRKADEPADDVGVPLGIFEVEGSVAEELHAAKLVGQILRMHEGHVKKFAQGRLDPRIGASGECPTCDLPRQSVARVGLRVTAKHVAGKLVEHDGQCQRAFVARLPWRQAAGSSLAPQFEKATAYVGVERLILLVPAIATRLAPEGEDLGGSRCKHRHTARGRCAASGRRLFLVAELAA